MRGKPKKGVPRLRILSVRNFYEVLKTCSAGRKDFFDTLRRSLRERLFFMFAAV